MKKSVLIMATLLSVPSYATTMCAENDSVAVILDPSINATSVSADKESMTWSAQFPYGRISGVSACLNIAGTANVATKNLTHTVDGITKPVVGGEQTGPYCWVRITHPVLSDWVHYSIQGYASARDCFIKCLTSDWGAFNRLENFNSPDRRRALFGSINN